MNDDEKLKKEIELRDRALVILDRSRLIHLEAEMQRMELIEFQKKYPDSRVDEMDWQEKEAMVKEAEILSEKVNNCKKKLKVVDEEYRKLREEVNTFYGRSVMPRSPADELWDNSNKDENDSADWWKRDLPGDSISFSS